MNYTIRPYEPTDQEMVNEWATIHNITTPAFALLPENGIIVMVDAVPVIACWVYIDHQAKVGFPHWLVDRPGMTLEQTRAAIHVLMDGFQDIMEANSLEILFTTVHRAGIIHEATKNYGWKYLGAGATLYKPS